MMTSSALSGFLPILAAIVSTKESIAGVIVESEMSEASRADDGFVLGGGIGIGFPPLLDPKEVKGGESLGDGEGMAASSASRLYLFLADPTLSRSG